ncbi:MULTISPECIES: HalOD1 output domain-containing protein [Halorussus]|uniref:HalOD1 output domain-containing protein n=1 Tax=Halorussus TaxID=1070314 RepID=UPI0020A04E9B|nr:HalOD1 output domain-containing protein [Halorussus vallis]USZ77684.1 hypothetical protein NGM07_08170 [Halorussus vallis]
MRNNGDSGELVYEIDDDESVSEAIPTAVGVVSGAEVTELTPLYTVVSPDALDALFAPCEDDTPRNGRCSVAFAYESYRVNVQGTDRVRISERE